MTITLSGEAVETLPIHESTQKFADKNNFEVKAYKFKASKEQLRDPRIVRIGLIQNCIHKPTTDPVLVQVRR